MEIALARVGDEEGSYGPVAIVRPKRAISLVETRGDSARLNGLQNRTAHGRVTKRLRQPQILGLRDISELAAMLGIMFVEQVPVPEPGTVGQKQERGKKQPDRDPNLSHMLNVHLHGTAVRRVIVL